jgi:PAS domain S-box-containing protein
MPSSPLGTGSKSKTSHALHTPVGQTAESIVKADALQNAILNSANFSSIATDAKGVIQIFNVGAERMLGYTAAEVMNTITPADISDPGELIALILRRALKPWCLRHRAASRIFMS